MGLHGNGTRGFQGTYIVYGVYSLSSKLVKFISSYSRDVVLLQCVAVLYIHTAEVDLLLSCTQSP